MASPIWIGTSSSVWSTAGNWSPTTAPVNGDSVTFDYNGIASVAGSDQSAVTLAALSITSTFQSFSFGDNATALKVKATSVRIGDPSGSSNAGAHSGRINLDLSTAQSTITVVGTKTTSTDTGKEPVRIKGTHASNKLVVNGTSRVGVATNASGDVATFAEIGCLSSGATINVGSGTTLGIWRQEAGAGNIYCAVATITQDGGTVNTFGTGGITTAAYIKGTANFNSSGTIVLLEVNDGGTANFLNDSIPKAVTNCKLYKGATLAYDPAVVTFTNPIQLIGCSLEDVTITTPNGLTVAVVKT